MTDSQPSSQIVSDEEEFEIKKILKKRFVWHKEEFKKKYLIKWVSYTDSHENHVCSERHSDVKSMKVNATWGKS
jgi:hypothetical protein